MPEVLAAFCYVLVSHEVCHRWHYCADWKGTRVRHLTVRFPHGPTLLDPLRWGESYFCQISDLNDD